MTPEDLDRAEQLLDNWDIECGSESTEFWIELTSLIAQLIKDVREETIGEIPRFLEQMRQGFYLGCRIDPHSKQINEFVRSVLYYLKRDGLKGGGDV